MRTDEHNKNYVIDLEKLYTELDRKRRQGGYSWDRLAKKLGVGKSTLAGVNRNNHGADKPKRSIDGNLLVKILMFLNKPHTDFVKTEPWKVYVDADSR